MEISKYITNLVGKMNLYIFPQYIWLVITYYLMINVVLDYFSNIYKEEGGIIKFFPKEAIEFNSLVMFEIDKWLPLLWFLGISIFISGFFIGLIEHLPFLEKEKVASDGKYGLTLGVWLLLIAFTIETFQLLGGYFPIVLFGITLVRALIEDFKKKKIFAGYSN